MSPKSQNLCLKVPAVVIVYQKENYLEADAPPANKAEFPCVWLFSISKFVSKIFSLNILHCWMGERYMY